LLSKRLKELESAGVIEHNPDDASYALTEAGWELFPLIQALGEWGQRWVRSDYGPDELDPGLLMWDVRRFLQPGGICDGRVVVQFVFPAIPARRRFYWVVDDGREVDLCLKDPGMSVDVQIDADLRALTQVWMGDARFEEAMKQKQIELTGPRNLTRTIPRWFGQHPILAHVTRAR
jgi:hypothetical protein